MIPDSFKEDEIPPVLVLQRMLVKPYEPEKGLEVYEKRLTQAMTALRALGEEVSETVVAITMQKARYHDELKDKPEKEKIRFLKGTVFSENLAMEEGIEGSSVPIGSRCTAASRVGRRCGEESRIG